MRLRTAVLLSAGLGTRLRPLTLTTPKCLVPIRGRPLLDYWIEMLVGAGVERIVINTHYLHETVEQFVNSHSHKKYLSLVYEPDLLGTGGTVLANRSFYQGESVLVAHADNLCRFSVAEFYAAHERRSSGCALTMMTFRTETPKSCGIVELGANGVVQAFHEKVPNPPGNLANGAVYLFEPEVVDYLGGLGKKQIDLSTEVIPHFIGRIQTYLNQDFLCDIGTPESLQWAEKNF